jgi:hypothetical protein
MNLISVLLFIIGKFKNGFSISSKQLDILLNELKPYHGLNLVVPNSLIPNDSIFTSLSISFFSTLNSNII